MTRVLAALLCAAVLSALGLGWKWQRTSAALAVSKAAVVALQAEVKAQEALVKAGHRAAQKHTKTLKLLKRQHSKEINALSAALARNPDWSNTDVPPDVAAALGVQRSSSAPQ